jgi:hypothetical protein
MRVEHWPAIVLHTAQISPRYKLPRTMLLQMIDNTLVRWHNNLCEEPVQIVRYTTHWPESPLHYLHRLASIDLWNFYVAGQPRSDLCRHHAGWGDVRYATHWPESPLHYLHRLASIDLWNFYVAGQPRSDLCRHHAGRGDVRYATHWPESPLHYLHRLADIDL